MVTRFPAILAVMLASLMRESVVRIARAALRPPEGFKSVDQCWYGLTNALEGKRFPNDSCRTYADLVRFRVATAVDR